MNIARLYITHVWTGEIETELQNISAAGSADTWLLLDSRTPGLAYITGRYLSHHIFDLPRLSRLPYSMIPTGSLVGHGHFPVLDFYLTHPDYDAYWFIEYDVRYTGSWTSFFARHDSLPCDLATTHIRRFEEEPLWPWWRSFGHPHRNVPASSLVRSFNVIYRISNRALQFLDRSLREGWRGHHEVLVSALLHMNGFHLLDFGGNGSFTNPANTNTLYTSHSSRSGSLGVLGTVRFRPSRTTAGLRSDTLYHPVKPPSLIEPLERRRDAYRRWQREVQSELVLR